MLAMKFSEKLKRLCGQRRWGQSNLLEFVPTITKSSMSNWFIGKYKPDLDSALKMARALEVPLDWLADDEADFPPPVEEGLPGDEEALLALYRALGLDQAEALRRLATPAPAPGRKEAERDRVPYDPENPWLGPQADMTGRFVREEAERNRPKPVERKKPAGGGQERSSSGPAKGTEGKKGAERK